MNWLDQKPNALNFCGSSRGFQETNWKFGHYSVSKWKTDSLKGLATAEKWVRVRLDDILDTVHKRHRHKRPIIPLLPRLPIEN